MRSNHVESKEHAPAKAVRLTELDGIRGWAALAVVIFHLGWETFGEVLPGFKSPIFASINGQLAVGLFFVLSGEALSAGFLATRDIRIVAGLAVRRPFRLSLPVFGSVMLVYIVQQLGLAWQHDAYRVVRRAGDLWIADSVPAPLTIFSSVKYSFLSMYGGDSPANYNPFTWTMPIELGGSILVFAVLPMIPILRYPRLVLLQLAVMCIFAGVQSGYYGCFLLGVACAMTRLGGGFQKLQCFRIMPIVSCAGIIVALVTSAYGIMHPGHVRLSLIAASILAPSIYCNKSAIYLFRTRFSQMLGKVSFALYLVQFPVIISFTSYAILYVSRRGSITYESALGIFALSLLIILFVALSFEPLEIFTRWSGRRIATTLLKPRLP